MQGITTFSSVEEALRAGFHVYDRIEEGFLVRKKTGGGWALAIVDLGLVSATSR
jgi:hypothetical protein